MRLRCAPHHRLISQLVGKSGKGAGEAEALALLSGDHAQSAPLHPSLLADILRLGAGLPATRKAVLEAFAQLLPLRHTIMSQLTELLHDGHLQLRRCIVLGNPRRCQPDSIYRLTRHTPTRAAHPVELLAHQAPALACRLALFINVVHPALQLVHFALRRLEQNALVAEDIVLPLDLFRAPGNGIALLVEIIAFALNGLPRRSHRLSLRKVLVRTLGGSKAGIVRPGRLMAQRHRPPQRERCRQGKPDEPSALPQPVSPASAHRHSHNSSSRNTTDTRLSGARIFSYIRTG